MRKFLPLLLLVCFLGVFPVRAQEAARAELYAFQPEKFPAMSFMLDAYDANGNLILGLQPEQVTILEDDKPRPVDSLTAVQPGAQFVVALNLGPDFAKRYLLPSGKVYYRYDKIAQALQDWAATYPGTTDDDLSLITSVGPNEIHFKDIQLFQQTLTNYQPDWNNLTATLDTLSRALDLADDPTPQPGMKGVVLFITPLPDPGEMDALANLTARAIELQIRVHVWVVASKDYFANSRAIALKDLAIRTGGQYALFSGEEPLPNAEDYLSPLRHAYQLSYSSGITLPGSHTLAVNLNVNNETISTPPLTFNLDVQPPNPMLVSPPEQIVRQSPDPENYDAALLTPETQELEIIVEFPDGRTRPIVRTTLYVDGQIEDENTAEPFDVFTWNLSNYTSSGQHLLQVEVEDSLGLSKISMGIPVTVTVVQPPRGPQAWLSRYAAWVIGGAVLATGGILSLVLILSARKRRSAAPRQLRRNGKTDPLTQPVAPRAEKKEKRSRRPRRQKAAPASLVRLGSDGQPVTAVPIPLSGEVTFGTDPTKAECILDDPSIAPLHARIHQAADGRFYVQDQKSVAGTWVNFEPVKDEPRPLEHGDILNFGQLSYRFTLQRPPQQSGPRLIPHKQ